MVLPHGGHAIVPEYQSDNLHEISAFLKAG